MLAFLDVKSPLVILFPVLLEQGHQLWHKGHEGDIYDRNPHIDRHCQNALEHYRSLLDEQYCGSVADIVGGNVTADRVREIIARANTGEHIFHGVKRERYMNGVMKKGIKPFTPEGRLQGRSSDWTSGIHLFGSRGKNSVISQGSGFFEYAHSYSEMPNKTFMNMAVTNRRALQKCLGEIVLFEPDRSQIELYFDIPREAMHLLRAVVSHPPVPEKAYRLSRQFGQKAEQVMFELLEKAMVKGYEPGGESVTQIKLDKIEPVRKPAWDIYS